MNFLNLHTDLLRSEDYLGAEPVERATWLNLLGWCATQENGGVIQNASAWTDRKWQQIVGITKEEATLVSALYHFDDDGSLIVSHYPKAKETEVVTKREAARVNGKKGGRPKKETNEKPTPEADEKPTLVSESKPKENPDPEKSESVMEGKGRKGNGKELPPKSPRGGKHPSADQLIDAIGMEFPETHWQAACDWALDKQSRSQAKQRFQSLNAWKACLKRMALYPSHVLTEAVDCAIASGWQGWEQEGVKAQLSTSKRIPRDESPDIGGRTMAVTKVSDLTEEELNNLPEIDELPI